MKVLIVAKTRMNNGCCIGSYSLDTGDNLRLLTSTGGKMPEDTEFEIGQIWDINFERPSILTPPHIEDVWVKSKQYISTQNNLNSFLLNTVPIWKGSPSECFEGKVYFPIGHSGYLSDKNNLPKQSVGFWLPDRDLELTIFKDQKHYYYFGDNQVYVFPYTGYKTVIDKISEGTLIRLSFARWWSPNLNEQEKRCYCQMSGWYLD